MPEYGTIPFGEFQGTPCICLDMPARPNDTFIADNISAMKLPGIRMLNLRSDNWATADTAHALNVSNCSSETQRYALWAYRTIFEADWCSGNVWTCLDVTELVAGAYLIAEVQRRMLKVAFIPQPAEIIVQNPAKEILNSRFLDELCMQLDPTCSSWVYLKGPDDETAQRALKAVTEACTSWGLRYG